MQKLKKNINFFTSRFFKIFPSNSLLMSSYKALTIQEKLNLRTPYTNLNLINFLKVYCKKNSNLKIFEYGSGSSTLFFEDLFDEVHSVEHDQEWFKIIKSRIVKANVYYVPPKKTNNPIYKSKKIGYKNCDFYEYVNFIKSLGTKFDVIFIDGRAREECMILAKDFLNPNGILILDDSNRRRYKKVFNRESFGKETLHFKGLGTFIPLFHKSSLIKKDNF